MTRGARRIVQAVIWIVAGVALAYAYIRSGRVQQRIPEATPSAESSDAAAAMAAAGIPSLADLPRVSPYPGAGGAEVTPSPEFQSFVENLPITAVVMPGSGGAPDQPAGIRVGEKFYGSNDVIDPDLGVTIDVMGYLPDGTSPSTADQYRWHMVIFKSKTGARVIRRFPPVATPPQD